MAKINVLSKLKNVWGKLNTTQKIIIFSSIAVVLIGFIFVVSMSTTETYSLLFKKPLSPEDYARITKKLEEWGVQFDTKDDKYILVKDESTSKYLRMKLGQEGILPQGIKGWELFDIEKFTTTDFERNVKLQRAIIGEIEKSLKMLDDIEDVQLLVSVKKPTLYSEEETPMTASVVITPAPYSDITKNKKKIKGIVDLVAHGIDGLKPENIVVVDNKGNVLSDLLYEDEENEQIKIAREQLKVKERIKRKIIDEVKNALVKAVPEDRFIINASVELDWTRVEKEAKKILPIEVKKDNPMTPFDESSNVLNVEISKKETKENFKGPAYIPEGPPGVERNVPPALKEQIDRFTHYQKNEKIVNYDVSTEKVKEKKQPYTIKKITVAVSIDGMWEIVMKNGEPVVDENGRIKRIYHPISKEDLNKYKKWIEAAVGVDPARGDKVIVNNIQFDRTKEFEAQDEEIRRKMRLRKTLLTSIIVLFILFVGTLVYRAIAREIARRRRLREEELARRQQAMRETAIREAEREAALVEMSMEDRARQELLEAAMAVARERPEDVAKLIRTWLSEE